MDGDSMSAADPGRERAEPTIVGADEEPNGGAREPDPDGTPLAADPLHGAESVRKYFADRYDAVHEFADLLARQGVVRGLIGPREVARIWERHILNSAALAPFLPPGVVADVGSGAGLPGMVIAAMEPRRDVVLIEPMERRTAWLHEAIAHLGLTNVVVKRGRAEELKGDVLASTVTARAVASIDKLVKWCAPLVAPGGEMVFLKGRSAPAELERAKYALRKYGYTGEVHEAPTVAGVEPTTVVRLVSAR